MIMRIGKPGLLAAASLVAAASFAFAHDATKKPADKTAMTDGCGEHHSEAMKARDQVSKHLAEAKRAGTLAEMRRHVEMAETSMAEMNKHVSMCMEMMHGGKVGAGTPPSAPTGAKAATGATAATATTAAKALDPVCGMEVETADAPIATYKSQTYYFCSEDDKDDFVKNPEQYAGKKP